MITKQTKNSNTKYNNTAINSFKNPALNLR